MTTTATIMVRPVSASYGRLRKRLEQNRRHGEKQLNEMSRTVSDPSLDIVADVYRVSVERFLADTEAALRRLDKGRYGRCEVCRDPIPLDRLELVPHASCCVGCQRLARD